ncbi:DUF7285 family protein [Haloarcula salina]|uniref:Uncharacterized protein n=1 Tax=Haloarcula salina TaxID=1429914 RepID=A0AA41G149_9EURY|nr:hypothetical protein [Haloarcula salina]MBV0901473.1 hypothetical protein [Haloarcula salina]
MSRSSGRATTEPLAALVAVFAVGVGLSLYAGVLDEAFGTMNQDRSVAAPTADAVEQRLSSAGIVDPARTNAALDAVPAGYRGNVTVTVDDGGRWSTGPTPPSGADSDTRTVSVRMAPGTVRRGRLRVRVWR